MDQVKEVRLFENWDAGVQRIPVKDDIKTMVDNYWTQFFTQFPEVTLEDFTKWIEEDTYGGWEEKNHPHAGGRRELKMLYVTVRATKPERILEIGTSDGTSANHILLAAEHNNAEGFPCKVTTVDIDNYVTEGTIHNYPVDRVLESSVPHLLENKDYDFIFQDGDHSPITIIKELTLFRTLPKLKTVFCHDYYLSTNITNTFRAYPTQELFTSEVAYKERAYKAGFYIGRV